MNPASFGRSDRLLPRHMSVSAAVQSFGHWIAEHCSRRLQPVVVLGVLLGILLGLIVWLQQELDRRVDQVVQIREQLRLLLPGEVLKPALLGFHHLGADLLWLRIIQVLGQKEVPAPDYEWAYHALDVLTTLDPHYVYAYDAGGIVLAELAGQVDWSNRLLKKGLAANPQAWRLAFQLGFNHFFHLHEYRAAAEYMAVAAALPGRPAYVPELAARLYTEAKHPTLALEFLASMRRTTDDPHVIEVLDRRRDEVLIERDLMALEEALASYWERHGSYPVTLGVLVREQLLEQIPAEPFGGTYQLDPETGRVWSSTHPRRLRLFRPHEIQPVTSAALVP